MSRPLLATSVAIKMGTFPDLNLRRDLVSIPSHPSIHLDQVLRRLPLQACQWNDVLAQSQVKVATSCTI